MRLIASTLVLGLTAASCGSNVRSMPLLPYSSAEPLWVPARAELLAPPLIDRYASHLRFRMADADRESVTNQLAGHFALPEWQRRISVRMPAVGIMNV
jgi:hypothetical protein